MIASLWAALDLFRTQKLRFLLTVSGIVVGVGSLCVLASLLEVGQSVLRKTSAEATGDDVVTIQNDWQELNNNPDARWLEHGDQEALEGSVLLPDNLTVTANYGLQDRKAQFGDEEFSPFTVGIEPATFEVYHLAVAKGRAFSASEYADVRRVAIAGSKVLDGALKPGDTVRVEGSPFVLVGILEEKPEMGPGGAFSWNNRLLFPARVYQLEFDPSRRPTNIVVKVAPPPGFDGMLQDYVLGTRSLMETVLMRDRDTKSFRFEGVSDDNSTEAIIFTTIEALLYLTTVFSMIVGGINIMNIMLVTVAERTREIGVRRALGAAQTDILRQFLAETVMVTLIGAILGVVGAVSLLAVGSWALTKWVTEWPFHLEPWSLVLSIVFSSAIGLVFGIYPAWRASRLDPVEALRFE